MSALFINAAILVVSAATFWTRGIEVTELHQAHALLSPLLGSLTDALGQRVSLALYPTYVNQAISDGSLTNGERVAPQLVLAAEVGYDLTSRLNASLLAAPNRSDVPPQFNLNYKATNNLSLEGSVDTEGTWQTQLQLFLRF